ncbi:glutamine amidotransferase [Pseudomonas sp. ABAC61]|nr:glutamine amidotransferase [Pseudomonas sp. ABAC61]
MPRAITLVTEDFADWETTLINATARAYYGFECRYASPGGANVTSMGGMRVMPDLALEDIDLGQLDLLMICGGTLWQSSQAPVIDDLLRQAGILDRLKHTSNSAANLLAVNYGGAAHYQDVPHAVADQRVVTAPGSAPVSFMEQILRTLGIDDQNLRDYIALHAAQHRQQG